MNRQQLEKFLLTGCPRAVLLYGEGDFWIEHYSKKIALKISDPQNITTFYFGDYDYSQILGLLGQSSLFGDETLVVLKMDKKISKKEIQTFLKALNKNPSNSLVIEFYRSDSRSASEYSRDFKEMAGAFKGENILEVRFFEPNLNESQMLLAQRARELGLQIESRSLLYLLNLQNGDLRIALKELEKFVYFSHPIGESEIRELCSSLGGVEFEDLLNALLGCKNSIPIYQRLEEEGLDEMGLLNALNHYFYRLFMIFAYIRFNGKMDAKEVLGYVPPSFVIDKLAREAMSLREKQYKKIFEVLIEWRIEIFSKKGRASPLVALHKIQSILQEFR